MNFSGQSNSTSFNGSIAGESFSFALIGWHTLIPMRGSDRLGEAIQNRTSLSALVWTVDSTVVQPTGCLKGQPAQRLSDSLPFCGTLKAQPSWSATRSGPLWHCKAPSPR